MVLLTENNYKNMIDLWNPTEMLTLRVAQFYFYLNPQALRAWR